MFTLEELLEGIRTTSPDNLRVLRGEDFTLLTEGLEPEEIAEFMFAKNLRIFGGINQYIDNFLGTGSIERAKGMRNGNSKIRTIIGMNELMERMKAHPDITEENRARLVSALSELNNSSAPAAGGRKSRKKRRGTRKATRIP